jgi:hypothetical protein
VPVTAVSPAPGGPATRNRAERLRSPLLLTLWGLLAIEAVGGLVIFGARLTVGATPGEALHVFAGLALTVVYAIYQWGHWTRVQPIRARLDYVLGLLSALFMTATNATGLVLGWMWWRTRAAGPVAYPSLLSGCHNIGSMLVLAFVAAHFGAVLMRVRSIRPPS